MSPTVTIGDCQLWLGDCRTILPSLAAGSVDCCVTDPPYGHNNNNVDDLIARWENALGTSKAVQTSRPIANDGIEANELVRWFFGELARLLAAGCCCCCCCGGGGPDPQFARWSLWLDEVLAFKQMVVWDKGPMGMGWHYRRSYETVLVGMRPGAACRWFADGSDVENIIRPGDHGIAKIIPQAHDHPTPKPVALAAYFVGLHTTPGHLILDPFMGRGWVGQACVQMRRRFVGIEIDAEHFDHACKRIKAEYDRMALFEPPVKVVNGERFAPHPADLLDKSGAIGP